MQVAWYQDQFTEMERCKKPVICAIHSACVGGGVDLVTATDIRLATRDAWFCVKEVDMGLAADVGTLQRLPKVTPCCVEKTSDSNDVVSRLLEIRVWSMNCV